MSVAAISSNNLFHYNTQSIANRMQQFQQEFKQLGQDLQSGNLSAAQADVAALQSELPTNSTSSSGSNNPISQEFAQLAKDLQSGNTAAAQKDYAALQQDFQSQAAKTHHHHHHGGGASGSSEISQLMTQLGQELQAGSLSSAQQTYSTLQQDFQQIAQTATTGVSAIA